MAKTSKEDRAMLFKMAKSSKLQQSVAQVADEYADKVRDIDPDAEIEIHNRLFNVNGLDRVVATVENHAPDSARKEFGGARQAGWRPMGRAAAMMRGRDVS